MSGLRRESGFGERGDDLYASLVEAHDGLDDAQSLALNARLVLLLANHIGDLAVIEEAIAAAREPLKVEARRHPSPQAGEVEQPAAAGARARGDDLSG